MTSTPNKPQLGKQRRITWVNPWSSRHYTAIAGGIGVIVVGYILLSLGLDAWDNPLSVSVAPIVLVIGYCVLIPLAIMWTGRNKE